MLDPLAFIFYPGAVAIVATMAAPLFIVANRLWRRRAKRLNRESRCGRCHRRLGIDHLFLFAGVYVCPACADSLRVSLRRWLSGAVGVAAILAITSGTALLVSASHNGPSLGWWLEWRWVPIVLPSVGLLIATAAAVTIGRRSNQLRQALDLAQLSDAAPVGHLTADGHMDIEDSRATVTSHRVGGE